MGGHSAVTRTQLHREFDSLTAHMNDRKRIVSKVEDTGGFVTVPVIDEHGNVVEKQIPVKKVSVTLEDLPEE